MNTPDKQSGNKSAHAFGNWVIRWRWPVIVATLLIVLAAGSGVTKLTFRDDYRAFFSEDNPQLTAFEVMEDIYTKNDNILFVLAPADGDAFSADTLAAVEELTDGAWQIPFALRVDSITNFQHTQAFEDDLIIEDLLTDARQRTDAEREKARRVALAEPSLRNRLVPDRTHVSGVSVTLQRPGEALDETTQAVTAARELADRVKADHPGLEIYMTGMVMLNNAFQEQSQQDAMTLVPAMFGVIVVVSWLLLRSLSGTFATLAVLVMSLISALGLAGWLGIALTPPSASAPTMIMTLAVADSIHILVAMLAKMRAGSRKRDAIVESLRINLQPVFLTSLTTAIGFLSLNFSDAPPFADLGNITAMGVTAAFFLSILFLPALMSVLPVRRRVAAASSTRYMVRLAEFVIRNRRSLLWASAAVVVVMASFVPANELNDQFVEYFDKSVAFRTDTDFVMDNLTGIYQIEHSLGGGESGGVNNPEYLAKLDEFAEWYEGQPGVVHVSSLSTTMKRLNKNLHGDDPTWYRTPEQRELAAQYLLLFEMSLPYGLDLNNQINIDKSSTRFTVSTVNMSSVELIELSGRGEQWLRDNAPESMYATAVSPGLMFAHVSKRNISSMLLGTVLAFGLISVTLAVALKSWRIGLLSLVPNVVPAAVGFGVWALWDGRVNLGLSVVTAMTLGIVVDDTVHFLSKYLRARREGGLNPPDSVRYAFATVGTALVVTSVILASGFTVLAQSSFAMNAQMGQLTAIVIFVALFADLLFLPPLLMRIDGRRGGATTKTVPERSIPDMNTSNPTQQLINPARLGGLFLVGALVAATLVTPASAAQAQSPAVAANNSVTGAAANLTPEERGLEIAIAADARDSGWGDSEATLRMILRNRHGEESTREMRSRNLEVEGDGDKLLVIFDQPADVRNTAFLTFTHQQGPDDQWLYLPALKRVKRISSNNKSGPFMGSEFAYEDLTSQEVDKYTYRWLRDETVDGIDLFVIERYPVDENSGYTRQVVWIDKDEYRTWKVDFYDRKGDLLKTLRYMGYREYAGKYWRPDLMRMVNHQTGKSTQLRWSEYEFQTGLADRDFNRNSLSRLR